MLSIIGIIPSVLTFLTGLSGTVGKVSDNIKELEVKKVEASSNKEKALIDAQIAEAHDRKDVLVAEAGNRVATMLNGTMRFAIAVGPAALIFKIFLWDKVLGSLYGCRAQVMAQYCDRFGTDKLDTNLWAVVTAIIAFYFMYDIAKRK